MNHKIIFPLMILFLGFGAIAQEFKEINLSTSIESVKVFTQGAQLTRTGKITLPAGKSSLIIKSLSPYIDENSIQAKGLGNFTLLSVNHRYNYLGEKKKDATIDSLQTILKELNSKIDDKDALIAVTVAKQKMLEENQKVAGTENGLTYEQLSKIVTYFTEELMGIKKTQLSTRIVLNELKLERDKIQNQINQITQQNASPAGEIVIRIDSKAGGKAEFTVSYFTQNAGWFPKYDIRVADITKPIQLDYKAEIYQSTQEDWNNVKLSLSNGNPNQGGIAPELSTWYLSFIRNNPPQPYYKREVMRAAPMSMDMAEEGIAEFQEVADEAIILQTSISQNPTTLEIEVEEPYSIQSNGERLTVNLKNYAIEASYEYYAVPKLDKDAFLIAKITNWDQYNLLEGEANLFFEGTFVGTSYLNPAAVSDTLEVSLGRDKSIAVERKKIDIYSKTNFIGSNKVESRGFKISIRNRKAAPIKITLFDQVPVSTIADITITPTEISKGSLNAQTGEISWVYNINPGEQKDTELKYEVKYPKKERVILE